IEVFAGTPETERFRQPALGLSAGNHLWLAAVSERLDGNAAPRQQAWVRQSTAIANSASLTWKDGQPMGMRQRAISDVVILPQAGADMLLLVNGADHLVSHIFRDDHWSLAGEGGKHGWFGFGEGIHGQAHAIASWKNDLYAGGTFG